jgi:hypothetical protein
MSDKVIVTGETISRVADMISEHNAKVAALEAELELTRKALKMLSGEIGYSISGCCICIHLFDDCEKMDTPKCTAGIAAWAIKKAKEEQR